MIKVKFRIFMDGDYICAIGQGVGIQICDKTWDELMEDISETVGLYYNLPPKAKFKLTMEMHMSVNMLASGRSSLDEWRIFDNV